MKGSYCFSAPGRTEISGNHTDHQHGCVLAAAVNLETVAEVTLNGTDRICVRSEGYAPVEIDLTDLAVHEEEKNSTAALIRGVAAALSKRGAKLQGFDAEVRSTVLPGSGLSSSAAFEVLIGTICNELFYDRKLSAVEIAQIGQYAENVYFGKPCGLMDQTASSVGGMVFIDFKNPAKPTVEKLDFDFAKAGHALCIIDSGADHADLTDEYAAIPGELKQLCRFFGREVLRDIVEEEFLSALPRIRHQVPDRAILRAVHFYQENKRVQRQAQALRNCDLKSLISVLNALIYLQNQYWERADLQNIGCDFAASLSGRKNGGIPWETRIWSGLTSASCRFMPKSPGPCATMTFCPSMCFCSGDRAVLIDWEYALILPYPTSLARLIAHGEEDENAFST